VVDNLPARETISISVDRNGRNSTYLSIWVCRKHSAMAGPDRCQPPVRWELTASVYTCTDLRPMVSCPRAGGEAVGNGLWRDRPVSRGDRKSWFVRRIGGNRFRDTS
jgi:hypothetical protein